MSTSDQLTKRLEAATEFRVRSDIFIQHTSRNRYTAHWPSGWVIVWYRCGNPMGTVPNIWFACADGKWRYKQGMIFDSAEAAWKAWENRRGEGSKA